MFIIARLQKLSAAILPAVALILSILFFFCGTGALLAQGQNEGQPKAFLIVTGMPGTRISREVGKDLIELGSIGKDGVWIAQDGINAGQYTFVFTHNDASEPLRIEDVSLLAGSVKKIEPQLKMKTGELAVTCLPADVEIFIDGKHSGSGALIQGNIPVGQELLVEARSSRYGTQAKRVKITARETQHVNFDLRGNIPSQKLDGKIVLPDVPLVLAMQAGAVVKVNGIPAKLEDGALVEVPLGECKTEIYLPLKGQNILVWQGAFFARSAILPAANRVAVVFPVKTEKAKDKVPAEKVSAADKDKKAEAPVPADASTRSAKVEMALLGRLTVALGSKAGLVDGASYLCRFPGVDMPVTVQVFGVTADKATLRPQNLPEGKMPKEGEVIIFDFSK